MAARSTNRFKQKPAVPFGDFMLPILGIVALGIVVMGIRILWGPSEADKPTGVAQPRPAQSQDVSQSASEKSSSVPKSSASGKETVDDVIIAQPVRRGGRTQSGSAGTESAKNTGSAAGQKNDAGQQQVTKVEPKNDRSAGGKSAIVRAGSIDKSQFVVQCGSYTDRSAANSVVASLKKIGYTAVVRQAEVRGKNYFRVVVAGGSSRELADEIASNIKEAGYPVLVRPND